MSSRQIDTDIRNRINPGIMNALGLPAAETKYRAKTFFISIHNQKHEFMINNFFMNVSLLYISTASTSHMSHLCQYSPTRKITRDVTESEMFNLFSTHSDKHG